MANYIATVESSITANGKKLDIAHWKVSGRAKDEAQRIVSLQIDNANRTIPSVTNALLTLEVFDPAICSYLRRNINCQGHKINKQPLKQQRGGNENA